MSTSVLACGLILGSALAAGVLVEGAQKGRARKPRAADTRPVSSGLKLARVGQWGVVSLSVPARFSEEQKTAEPQRNGDVTWTEYTHSWELPRPNIDAPLEEVVLFVTTWDADFSTVTGLKPEVATPELLLAADYATDEGVRRRGEQPIEELRYLELGGVRGEFFRLAGPGGDSTRVWLNWHGYRHFRGKAQRISLSIMGARKDLDELTRALRSLQLSE